MYGRCSCGRGRLAREAGTSSTPVALAPARVGAGAHTRVADRSSAVLTTAISDLVTQCQAAEDVAAMTFDPEPAPPQAEIVSPEMHLGGSQTSAENLETPLVAPEVWRERGEELVPVIFDPEARSEPGRAAWNEPVAIASAGEVAQSATEPGSDQHMWLMPNAEPGSGRERWYQVLLTQLRENYKVLCQSAALIAVGAVAALLVVGFAHSRSPLPAGLQGAEKIRQQVPLAKARRKPVSRRIIRRIAAKSAVAPKNAVGIKPLKPEARAMVVPGKVSLASSQQQVLSKSPKHSHLGSESNFVAKDSVTRYGDHRSAPAPK